MESKLEGDLGALEFDLPCDSESCTTKAVVVVSLSHSAEGCWSPTRNWCDYHVAVASLNYAGWLSRGGWCEKCRGLISGPLSDNVRAIHL